MKKFLISASVALTAMVLLTSCLNLSLGGGSKNEAQYQNPSVGQQLIDLQRARDTGAISPEEYQTQKAKVLANK